MKKQDSNEEVVARLTINNISKLSKKARIDLATWLHKQASSVYYDYKGMSDKYVTRFIKVKKGVKK